MKCIIALMLSAIAIANETGLGRIHPGLGIAVCAVIFWGAVKLIYASI